MTSTPSVEFGVTGSSSGGGGFIEPSIPSPPPSSITSASLATAALPRPREHPLKSGGPKETGFIQYVDRGILQVTRRYAKKYSNASSTESGDDEVRGYESFKEVGKDVERLIDVVWVSGTPSLQIPYLLSLALLLTTYLPSFPPTPRTTFRLLRKLDHAFSSLLQGRDVDSGDSLPGFDRGRGLSTTEKVRIKSLVERTRVVVVETMRGGDAAEEAESEDEDADDDASIENEGTGDDEDDSVYQDEGYGTKWDMDIARVYDRTVVELGESIGEKGG
ncbi:MAG: hypothetical protein M1825_005418 [Sarcosagium campestre]|nr:MAG: hypothetical protein M1825_005418 [Sarcosagium campestre]